MVTRIATYFQNQNTLRNLQLSNQSLNLTSYQITTGLKAQNLSDISSEAYQLLSLRDVKSRTQDYLDNATAAKNQLTAVESALQQMTDILSDAASTATLGRNESSAETRATLVPKVQSMTESFYTIYKSQYNGRYLFSGSDSANPPLNTTAAATAYPGEPLPTGWYQGDTNLPTVVTGPSTTLSYGVLGNDNAFAQMKAGLESLWYGLKNNNTTEMDSAIATLNKAKQSLSGLLGQVGGQLNTAQLVIDRQTNQKEFIQNQLNKVEKVDVASAITQFSQQQATMQASMAIITKVNQLSLLDYLR